jgi:CDGSH-type Zn-finger protein
MPAKKGPTTKAPTKGPGKEGMKVKVLKDGPYLVTGGVPLVEDTVVVDEDGDPVEYHRTKEYPLQLSYALCRCGRTKNPPFCDGAHANPKWDGTERARREPYLEQAERFEGPELDLTDAESLCAGARFCHRMGGTWNLAVNSDDPEAKRLAIEEAGDCPSGRLVVWDKAAGKEIEPDLEPSIGLIEDQQAGVSGPIWVRGGIPIEAADGNVYEVRNRVTLCRCGRSENMPFCDGSHMD